MPRQSSSLTTHIINGLLGIEPLANALKQQARTMMIKRAEGIGVPWQTQTQDLGSRGSDLAFHPLWDEELAQVQNLTLTYPDYYLRPFHAYRDGNLGWLPALEVEVAARAVHAKIWPEAGAQGDAKLRQSYHQVLRAQLASPPQTIVDLGCSVGMSTETLQTIYPQAQVTGVDLSPYFLTVARYRQRQTGYGIQWVHAPAEATGLPDESFELASACLVFHELPQAAAVAILREAYRLVRPGGYLGIMDMNPASEVFATLPAYVFTLLKSTEPYLDDYFELDLPGAIVQAGFNAPTVTSNSPRHRTLVARKA